MKIGFSSSRKTCGLLAKTMVRAGIRHRRPAGKGKKCAPTPILEQVGRKI
ncbi:hypothetical protein A33M_1269 [Rhodovulum sp. PH10]|nr:hypothetical protein A33M_1269 [Rhodovulum sp. PH10]